MNRSIFSVLKPFEMRASGLERRLLLLNSMFVVWALIGLSPQLEANEGFEWVFKSGQQAMLLENGDEVLTYQIAPRSQDGGLERSNYIHPLWDLAGDIVTEDFPDDHYHHRGIFWAWHQLLSNGVSLADPWNCENIKWRAPPNKREWVHPSLGPDGASLRAVHDWAVTDLEARSGERRVVRETVEILIRPAELNRRVIDFDLSLLALEDGISIGGSADDKGYGGFSPRVRLADDVQFVGQVGPVTPERTAVQGGAWMNVINSFNGRTSGVVMMVHPSHPGFPLKWILRSKRSMQNPQWPGQEPVVLSVIVPTRLRYRLVLHNGRTSLERLDSIWQDFSKR
ncbi:PmoA family protein [Verrucomicrobia bacterium]|jgi:hypothetical protein|nr:PmoA family protein [Verrucomicrobiota bacterium]MDB4746332.1 PmoA family protein [Verrucomicrobiota bacterium]MDB4798686.1 PmoA family protein [Verrucomicrobiota bacterium]